MGSGVGVGTGVFVGSGVAVGTTVGVSVGLGVAVETGTLVGSSTTVGVFVGTGGRTAVGSFVPHPRKKKERQNRKRSLLPENRMVYLLIVKCTTSYDIKKEWFLQELLGMETESGKEKT